MTKNQQVLCLNQELKGIKQEGSFFIGLTMLKNFAKRPCQEHRKNIKNEERIR
jgi:hypothetical protein